MISGQVSPLKEAVIPLELRGLGGRIERVEATIDTGFDGFLTIPADMAARLHLPFLMTRFYELGDGGDVEFDIHQVAVAWDGRVRDVEAVITSGVVLVGMSLLTGYHLFIDVVDGGEVRIEARP